MEIENSKNKAAFITIRPQAETESPFSFALFSIFSFNSFSVLIIIVCVFIFICILKLYTNVIQKLCQKLYIIISRTLRIGNSRHVIKCFGNVVSEKGFPLGVCVYP